MRVETHFQMYVVDGHVRATGAPSPARRTLRRPRRGPRPAPPGPPGVVAMITPVRRPHPA